MEKNRTFKSSEIELSLDKRFFFHNHVCYKINREDRLKLIEDIKLNDEITVKCVITPLSA